MNFSIKKTPKQNKTSTGKQIQYQGSDNAITECLQYPVVSAIPNR